MNKISVIVPCYNERQALPEFYEEVKKALLEIEDAEYEFIFIDDGSSDGTDEILRELAHKDSRCRYIVFSRNFGKEAGMYAGLEASEGDYCVIMDADLQHPPELLKEMYRAVTNEGYDCCGGMRKGREGDGMLRSILSRAFYKICKKLTHLDMSDGKGDYRMMSRKVVDAILELKEYNRYMKGLFSFVGFETKWIEYDNVERKCGESKWSFRSLFAYALEGIMSFSTAPLKLAGVAGVLLLSAGVVFTLVKLVSGEFMAGGLGGYDVVLAAVLLLSGMQMIFIYILGAYLSKDYLENKKRPVYIIKEKG